MLKKGKPMWSRIGGLIVAVLLGTSGAAAQQRVLVLEGGTLIDGTGRGPIADAVVVVEGSRIKAVGTRGQVSYPTNATVIKLSGRTILPGLIDGHVHFQEYEMPMFLPYGVTTIADLNNDTAWILAQRDAVKSGKIKGPRMFVSGSFVYGTLRPLANTFTPPVRTVEEARAYVRSLVAAGVDIIKVDNSITYDQLRAVIEEANAAGLRVLGHTQNIRKAAEVGMKHMEHMDTMARALLDPEGKIPPRLFAPQSGPVEPPQVAPEAAVDPKQFPPLIDYMVRQPASPSTSFSSASLLTMAGRTLSSLLEKTEYFGNSTARRANMWATRKPFFRMSGITSIRKPASRIIAKIFSSRRPASGLRHARAPKVVRTGRP